MDSGRIESLEVKLSYLEKNVLELDALMVDYGRRTERLEETMRQVSRRVVELGADKDPAMPAGVRPPHY
jgi:uncharacterized coiled-coil protein SlyX